MGYYNGGSVLNPSNGSPYGSLSPHTGFSSGFGNMTMSISLSGNNVTQYVPSTTYMITITSTLPIEGFVGEGHILLILLLLILIILIPIIPLYCITSWNFLWT